MQTQLIDTLTREEVTTVNCAIGRIFGMLQREEKPGDAVEYERCRKVIMEICHGR
jgi:hypothetical protein